MRKTVKTIILLSLLLSLCSTLTATANRAPFQAVPILPANQISDRAFYDIHIAHNEVQDLYLVLRNDTLEDIEIVITAITATTDANGKVLYSQKGYSDRTLKHSFETLISPNPSVVTVPALTEIETSVRLSSPTSRYEGIVLGALHVTTKADDTNISGIVNAFAYSLAVRLTGDPTQNIIPDIKFEKPELHAGERSTGFLLDIRNIMPELFRYAELTIDVYSDDTTVFSNAMTVDFAPNSYYPLTLRTNRAIAPGVYTADVAVQIKNEFFYFTEQFIVHDNDSNADMFLDALNLQRIQAPAARSLAISFWLWLFSAILLLSLIFVAILLYKRKRKDEDKNPKIKSK
ncbi:MAG: DUF916 and DUF3324 domain-containing protein [Oscillospiraceae bacterium]|nr:DUF916 and DUF3324 domain-containing protein [Oscillospiraceae bacterium]